MKKYCKRTRNAINFIFMFSYAFQCNEYTNGKMHSHNIPCAENIHQRYVVSLCHCFTSGKRRLHGDGTLESLGLNFLK